MCLSLTSQDDVFTCAEDSVDVLCVSGAGDVVVDVAGRVGVHAQEEGREVLYPKVSITQTACYQNTETRTSIQPSVICTVILAIDGVTDLTQCVAARYHFESIRVSYVQASSCFALQTHAPEKSAKASTLLMSTLRIFSAKRSALFKKRIMLDSWKYLQVFKRERE